MATKPDVRVRLSAEGVKEVTDAMRKIADETIKQGKRSQNAFKGLAASFGGLRSLISKISLAIGAISLKNLIKDTLAYAESTFEAAQKTGATTEEISALRLAASTTGVEFQQLEKGLIRFSVNLQDLREGTTKQKEAFARLGLEAKDFVDLTTGQAFVKVSEKLGNITDSAAKTAIAYDILGKGGAQLIVLMNDLANGGFARVSEEAERMGLTVDQQTGLLADIVSDKFTEMKGQVKGLALQFITGLLPSVFRTMEQFKKDTAGKGVDSAHTFGQEVGRVLRIVIQLFRVFETVVGGVFETVGNVLGATAAAFRKKWEADLKFIRGDFKGAAADSKAAADIMGQVFSDAGDIASKRWKELSEELDQLVIEANTRKIEMEVEPKIRLEEPEDIETEKEKAALDKAAKEAERIRKEQERLAKETAEKIIDAKMGLFDVETKLLELEGKRHEVFERNLTKEREEIVKMMDVLGIAEEERAAFFERFDNVQNASFNFDNLKEEFSKAMDELDRARDRINTQIQAGVIRQFAGEQQIIELEKQRIPILDEIMARLMAQAQLLGPQAVAEVEKINASLIQLQITQAAATDASLQFKNAAAEGLESGLSSVLKNISEFEDAGDIIKGVFRSIAQSIADLAAEILAKQATLAILKSFGSFSIGGPVGLAQGGLVGFSEGGLVTAAPRKYADGGLVKTVSASPTPRKLADRIMRFAKGGVVKSTKEPSTRSVMEQLTEKVIPRFAEGGLVKPAAESSVKSVIERLTEKVIPRFAEGGLVAPAQVEKSSTEKLTEKVLLRLVESGVRKPEKLAAGGIAGYPRGGHVHGTGTETSDSNLAWLSKGEFVVRAAVVKQPGVLEFLSAFNSGYRTPSLRRPSTGTPRFATGGLNSGGSRKEDSSKGTRIVNVLDPNLINDAIGSPAGEKVIMNFIQRNSSGISRLLSLGR